MTIIAGTLDSQQQAISEQQAIIDAAQVGAIRSNQFTYFAAFDGTNNDEFISNGDPQTTNVRQLYEQAFANESSELKTGYFAGPGTEGTLTNSSWLSPK